MSEANFASLSPTLLARKGAARPAMRPQVQPLNSNELHGQGFADEPHDDLGWNDMGDDAPDQRPQADVIAFEGRTPVQTPVVPGKPDVLRQREDIVSRVAESAPATTAKGSAPRRKAIAQGRRAAFTLRIDQDRHLKLRLACTLANRSAQSLITEALDAYLEAQDEIAEIAARVGGKNRSNRTGE